MKLPLLELRRRPSRFVVATVVLSFLATLLLFLGGLLDGLYLGSTGAIRAQQADVIVFSESARDSFLRSRITPDDSRPRRGRRRCRARSAVSVSCSSAPRCRARPSSPMLRSPATRLRRRVCRPRRPTVKASPTPGWRTPARRRATSSSSVPAATPITIVGFVDDTSYLLQSSVWVNLATWRDGAEREPTRRRRRPRCGAGAGGEWLRRSRRAPSTRATGGATKTLTKDDAVLALPGVKQQRDTFNQIIYSTLVVVLAVVGLFFSLLTLERLGLYGVLKAIGASSRRLFTGVVLQAVIVAIVAFVVGLAAGGRGRRPRCPPAVPLQLTPARFLSTFVGLVVAAVLGSAISLRKVTKVDPASAIGNAS